MDNSIIIKEMEKFYTILKVNGAGTASNDEREYLEWFYIMLAESIIKELGIDNAKRVSNAINKLSDCLF